ncbi:MAG: acyltransferase [Acidimicrobiales bacterium]
MTEPAGTVPDPPPAWTGIDQERIEHEPWLVAYQDPTPDRIERLAELNARDGYDLAPTCYVAPGAHVVAARLTVGAHTTIAAGCTVRGDVALGEHCALNVGAATIGKVRIGSGVRIASYAVLVGENHGIDDLDLPIAIQPLTSEGIVVEDDVWIGANTTITDGVTIGAHSVVAAGAVVTSDVAPWSVVGGVPARLLRDRRAGRGAGRGPSDRLARFDRVVAEQWSHVLARCEVDHEAGRSYVDVPGHLWGPRPQNDAIEIAAAFGEVAPAATREAWIERIQAMQDPATGMFIDPRVGPADEPLAFSEREWDLYGLLSCGYALEVLGSGPAHPVHAVERCGPSALAERLGALDWGWLAWPSGSWIDGFATGAYLNRRHHGSTNTHDLLWGWLATHVDRRSGMWGRHLEPESGFDFRWLMAVNGYYRMTRGTYAQFGVPLPHPEAAIDTVLAHARDWHWFEHEETNACNVLDIVHPLWLLGRQVPYRSGDVRAAASRVLDLALAAWVDGQGAPWQVGRDEPGLQGTEMWLSIAYLAADVLGESEGLSWRPRGVHRLEPGLAT